MNNLIDRALHRIGRVTCGQALIWSLAANVVMFTLLVLSIVRYPAPAPGEIEQRATELHQMRQANHPN